MKILRVLALTALVSGSLLLSESHATEVGNQRTFGLGLAVGSPTSIVGKLFVGAGRAVDFGIGFSRYGHGYGRCWYGDGWERCGHGYNNIGLHADYLWQNNLIHDQVTLDWHIGVGGRLVILDRDGYRDRRGDAAVALAARMPVGLDLTFRNPAFLEVYIEVAPTLYLVPGLDLDVYESAIGVRFYF